MKVGEVMTHNARVAGPDETVQAAAKAMAEPDTGALPVGGGDRLVGMVTGRDIAVRAVAEGKGPDAKPRDVMTPEIRCCFEDEGLGAVVSSMGDNKARRLPVTSRDKRLVGIVSLGGVALYGDSGQADAAASAASEPGGPSDQTG